MARRIYLGIAESGEDNWSISFPAFPGIVTTGTSLTALLLHAGDALASAIDAMQEEGEAIPDGDGGAEPAIDWSLYRKPRVVLVAAEVEAKSIRINVTMDEGLVARLDRLAARMQSSRSALLARGARVVLEQGVGG